MTDKEKIDTVVPAEPLELIENKDEADSKVLDEPLESTADTENIDTVVLDEQLESTAVEEETDAITTVEQPASTQEEEEPYSEFITENPEHLPSGTFFNQDSLPLIIKIQPDESEAQIEEDSLVEEGIEQEDASSEGNTITSQHSEKEKDQETKKVFIEGNYKKISQFSKAASQSLKHPKRKSTITSSNIYYDFIPRMIFDDISTTTSYNISQKNVSWGNSSEYMSEEEIEEEEEEEEENKDEAINKISRTLYYEKVAELSQLICVNKIRNTLLQRRVAVYYRRKKMDYALQEIDQPFINEQKYRNHLNEYQQILKENVYVREVTDARVEFLKQAKEKKSNQLKKMFQSLQMREREMARGLIHSKTGTEISEKLVQQLINRQKISIEEAASMRLKLIKLRILVIETEGKIKCLDKVDETHRLGDYEKLKDCNKLYCDKIEEKEVELTELRLKCKDTIQMLAHFREKISALDSDVADLKDTLTYLNWSFYKLRSKVGSSKKERDTYRSILIKIQEKSGLLKETELLKDMEHSIHEVKELKQELHHLKETCETKIKKIRCIRKCIEEAIDIPTSSSKPEVQRRKSLLQQISSKEVITGFHPVTPVESLGHLKQDFQPTVRRICWNK